MDELAETIIRLKRDFSGREARAELAGDEELERLLNIGIRLLAFYRGDVRSVNEAILNIDGRLHSVKTDTPAD